MIPQYIAHRFDNISDHSILVVAYTNIQFNKDDTFSYKF